MPSTDLSSYLQCEILDETIIQQLIDLDDGSLGLLKEMIQIFQEDTPSRLETLGIALKENLMEDMGDMAHAIKGAGATIGVNRVRALALALETAGRKGTMNPPPSELFEQLNLEFQKALDALNAFVAARE